MIEKIHRYSGLLMAVLVISAIAFIFGDFNRGAHGGYGGGQSVIKINGVVYNSQEFDTLGKTALELCYGMQDMDFYQFAAAMAGDSMSKEQGIERFFTSRMILREAKAEYGIYPGENEITEYLRAMRAFAGQDGTFSAEKFRNFIQISMGRFGMSEKDLRGLVSDIIAYKKLREVVGGGFPGNRDAVAQEMALSQQQISGETAKLDLAPYEEKIQPTEEEIKTYWEGIKDSFTTEAKRKFSYILVAPGAVEEKAAEATPETPENPNATEEEKQAAAKKKEEEAAKRAADQADARRKKQTELDGAVDNFMVELQDRKGAGFEDLAKENGWEVKTTELFTLGSVPKELDLDIRASSRGGKLADELFKIQETPDPLSKISEAIPVGENQWVVARLDGEEKSREKEFAEARDEARAQYISEKGAEALKTATTEAITKIKAAIEGGKSFTDAAKEAGLSEVKEFTGVSATTRPDTATQPQNLFTLARTLDPGAIAEPVVESDRAFVLHVSKREVVKDPNAAATIDAQVSSQSMSTQYLAFDEWLNAKIDAAQVETLYNKR